MSQELDKTCQEQFVSTPQYMGPHLVGLEWLGVTQMSGVWNQPEASSLTCLVSGLGRAEGWAQLACLLELSHVAWSSSRAAA